MRNLLSWAVRDRRRAQRGSVLSAVLIITAFIAIISGALATQLSTNFLLSRDLMSRITVEATVSSANELAIDSVQNSDLTTACPALTAAPVLNGAHSAVSYLHCALVTDSTPVATTIAHSASFDQDGTYVSLPGVLPGVGNEYLAVDSQGTLFAFPYGSSVAAWSYPIGGPATASPMAMAVANGGVADLAPFATSSTHGIALLTETTPGQLPTPQCVLGTNASVVSRPAAGRNVAGVAYAGDTTGTVFAFDVSGSGVCNQLVAGSYDSRPVVAGPLVYPGTGGHDRLFVIVSDGSSSTLEEFRFTGSNRNLTLDGQQDLGFGNVIGMAADSTSLPARIAITSSGGQVAIVQVSTSFNMTLTHTGSVPGGGVTPPTWCNACAGGAGLIGIAGQTGMFVLDSNLSQFASFTGGSFASAPAVDAGGDWFAAGGNGSIVELQGSQSLGAMTVAQLFPAASGAISSAPVLHTCSAAAQSPLCVYFASADSNAYLISLDAREIVVVGCISSQGSCTSTGPRLWTHALVGASGNPRAVRVLGFSYYSP